MLLARTILASRVWKSFPWKMINMIVTIAATTLEAALSCVTVDAGIALHWIQDGPVSFIHWPRNTILD
jgi:hypothetical protein